MKSRSLLSLLFLLLIAAAIPSCKSPTATTQSSAFTLILPDSTVAWGDSAMMRVVPAKPLSSSSVFTWSFGDSSSLVSRSDTIIHYYPDTGVFTVKVALNDTSNKSQLGTETGTVKVAARHFNLALLQTMKYVDVTISAHIDTTYSGNIGPPCYTIPDMNLLGRYVNWSDTGCLNNSSYSSSNYDTATGEDNTESGYDSLVGVFDPESTELVKFSEGQEFTFQGRNTKTLNGCYTAEGIVFKIENLPFYSGSGTDLVFEGKNQTIRNAYYSKSLEISERIYGDNTLSINANFKTNSSQYIRIRFHN